MALTLRSDAFRAWVDGCARALAQAREEIDALNVFPVPDGDTGTNAYLTLQAGAEAVQVLPAEATVAELVDVWTAALLRNAKGNCGVILSQLARAGLTELVGVDDVTGHDLARALRTASDAAWAAVGRPVEGTILSVAAAAADGAESVADQEARLVFGHAAASARTALLRTPTQLARLAEAGVVDAGGRALVAVLDATDQALTGRTPEVFATTVPVAVAQPAHDFVAGGPAYEVMYLLEAEDDRIGPLRERLDGLGDSLVVVGGSGLWNVHVHVDDVGAAVEAGLEAGRPSQISVTHFADQIAHQRRGRRTRVVLSAVTGPGLAALSRDAGARVMEFTRGASLGVDDMIAALREAEAAQVIVLPNTERFIGAFEAAAKVVRADGIRVSVIPTRAQVQGLAALAVHDASRDFDDDVVAMTSAAAHTQHGGVTVAVEPGMTMAGPCQAGDALGIVHGDFAFIGADLTDTAVQVVDRLLSPATEIVTLILGEDAPAGLGDLLEKHITGTRFDVDVAVFDGGQERYPLFVAVE